MNKEELIGKLQMVYAGDKNALNKLIGYYDGLKQGIEELQQENKQLQEKLDKYENPEDMTLMYMWCNEKAKDKIKQLNSCQEEIRRLKKQLEDYKKLGFKHLQDKNNNLETQQKEFIKYLEDESKEIYRDGGLRQNIFRQILQKYKSIIGVLDEKSNNISS